ncbi:MAG: T9SS type A sorting domain-containing protein [Sphingobacteriales bacterium]|nr:T9SS type A sorting domain-containing protein [Sphingobacteriales bacterium]
MRKMLLFLTTFFGGLLPCVAATVNINTVGFSYSPSDVMVNVGDVINIAASITHPTTQVNLATWTSNGTTPISGALFVSETSPISFTVTAGMAGTIIYYVCENHVFTNGMKGKINVNLGTGLEENAVREFNFTVYPNPVNNNSALNISLKKNDNVDVKIFSINGKLISNYLQQKMNAGEYTMPFNAARLESGIYILQLKTSQGILRKQIMVTH